MCIRDRLPTSPPGTPQVSQLSGNNVSVAWPRPTETAEGVPIKQYNIQYSTSTKKPGGDTLETEWKALSIVDDTQETKNCEFEALEDKIYIFRVSANCDQAGESKFSESSEPFQLKEVKGRLLNQSSICIRGKILL